MVRYTSIPLTLFLIASFYLIIEATYPHAVAFVWMFCVGRIISDVTYYRRTYKQKVVNKEQSNTRIEKMRVIYDTEGFFPFRTMAVAMAAIHTYKNINHPDILAFLFLLMATVFMVLCSAQCDPTGQSLNSEVVGTRSYDRDNRRIARALYVGAVIIISIGILATGKYPLNIPGVTMLFSSGVLIHFGFKCLEAHDLRNLYRFTVFTQPTVSYYSGLTKHVD